MPEIDETDTALLSAGLPPLKSLALSDGAVVQYREAGPSDGEPLLLLHGLGSHSGGWRGVIEALRSQFRVIAWDAPGFGGSAPLANARPRVEDYALHLETFAAALGLSSFHLAGSSWGSVIALGFAARSPKLVRSLTLLAPNACLGSLPDDVRAEALEALLSPDLVLEASPSAFAAMLLAPDSPRKVRDLAGMLREHATDEGYRAAVHMMAQTEALQLAASLQIPALVLAGDVDTLAPLALHSLPISEALSEGGLTVLPGYGHLLKLECPAVVAAHIASHVARERTSGGCEPEAAGGGKSTGRFDA